MPVIIIGAGGHAKVVLDAALSAGLDIISLVTIDLDCASRDVFGVPTQCGDEWIEKFAPKDVELLNGIGGVRDTSLRRDIFLKFREKGYRFSTLVHPTAIVGRGCELAEGCQLMAGCILQSDVKVGANALINTGAQIDHDCTIGCHTHIAPGVVLSGNVRVGESTHIGTGATLIQNIDVGKECLIGAGSVVLEEVPRDSTVIGVPGKVISR